MLERADVATTPIIRIQGARQHNLKNVSLDIPRDRLVVLTGLSGSGKSSLAFDTIHAEGQRKYIETLSAYARQFLEQLQKPDVDHVEGLPPTIAIEQRSGSGGPRSTVATTTEVYDYLRLLFARVGEPHCWVCGRRIERQTTAQIVDAVTALPAGTRILVLAPLVRGQKGEHQETFRHIQREGFVRVRVDGELYEVKSVPRLARTRKHHVDVVVDRLVVRPEVAARVADSVNLALALGNDTVFIAAEDSPGQWRDRVFSVRFACPLHPEAALPELSPRMFSFNAPQGACPTCDGLGHVLEFDAGLVVPDDSLSLAQGAVAAWRHAGRGLNVIYRKLIEEFCRAFNVSPDTPWRHLPVDLRDILLHGTPAEESEDVARFEGILPNLKRRWESSENEALKQRLLAFMSERPCETCGGARLRKEALAVTIAERHIHDLTRMSIEAAHGFLSGLSLSGERAVIAGPILAEIVRRLRFMMDVGVGYLGLDRAAASLSGGEAQRIRLATQVGSGLVGVCYVLDEPTIGLHQRDSAQLIRTLRKLTDAGNTVLVVEHDEDMIRAADHLIDIGPGAGAHGGRIVAQGSLTEVLAHPESITAAYLTGRLGVPLPEQRRKVVLAQCLEIQGASEHNLKNIDVKIPLGCFVCVTGVSGSGKSTLVNEVLLKALRRRLYGSRDQPGRHRQLIGAARVDKVVEIDQSPIGRTPRSNPCTYTGAFDLIRDLFARTREAKLRGYGPGRFSFNVKGGRCEACQGQGTKRIEMHFLPDVYVACDACKGTRYNRETLEIRYRGLNIADVLNLRVEEAIPFFEALAGLKQILLGLDEVGLSYLTLGQASTTLSGGEAQRVKLAAELAKTPTGHTLYVLDEPTTGLHFADVANLLRVLNRLADKGHTILVIEHNLEVIKMADWIIDLGPEGGDQGGEIVAQGRPEEIIRNPRSYTGRFLAPRLKATTSAS
ncbi:MAG: excinuclease ABC subunit UvrA [Phycisphaerae bacterium]|jgi:excinuclease ABC subunit A